MTAAAGLDPRHGAVRGVRAAVLTVPAVGVTALGHAAAGGCTGPTAVVLAMGLCWPAAVAVLGARRRMPALLVCVLAMQVATHAVLEWLCTDAQASGGASGAGHALSPAMLAAHVVGAVVTAVVLGRADAGLWVSSRLLRAAHRGWLACVALLATAQPLPTRRPVPLHVDEARPARVTWRAVQPTRRGPPRVLAAL